MQPPSARLVCRARNSFSPSTALWQHFVVPNQHLLRHGRCSSSVTAATQDTTTTNTEHHAIPGATAAEKLHIELEGNHDTSLPIRKVRSIYSNFVRSKQTASIRRNVQEKLSAGIAANQESMAAIGQLLIDTTNSYAKGKSYQGVAVKPVASEIGIKPRFLPWCIPLAERPPDAMDRLSREIELFHKYMRPDHFETLARKHLIEQVRNHVRETHPSYALEVFGSERTGVAFATSDIDLRLVHQLDLLNSSPDIAAAQKPPGEDKKAALTTELHKIHRNLQSAHPEYVDPTFRWARYPLIVLRDRDSGLEVQIVAANDSSISRGCMAKYMAEYPYLGSVYSVVKAMFDIRGLSNVFMGGFGSYSLFMMLVASIKHAPSDRNDAAGALVNFLHFWRHFDTTAHGVSIEPVEFYSKKEAEAVMNARARKQIRRGRKTTLPPFMLSLRDPADATNDLGRKGIAIKHVQATLAEISGKLAGAVRHNTLQTMLSPLVDPVYMLNKENRLRLRNCGINLTKNLDLSFASTAKAVREAEETESAKGARSAAAPEAQDLWEGLPGMESDTKAV